MNVFEPTGDTLSKRPVIIICFGGGFVSGNKDHWSMRLLAQDLAKRGFVTALIDYRLGMNIFNRELSKRAVYRGIQDGRSAVRYFKADASGPNLFRVDSSQVYIGGHSAGAFVATHNAYMDTEAERPLSTISISQSCNLPMPCPCSDQLCLDCVGDNTSFNGKAKAVFSMAGAVGDTLYMESEDDPIIAMFHSTDDGTVPFNSGRPFSNLSPFIFGFDLPTVFGSNIMHRRAGNLSLPDTFKSYTNRGHGVHELGTTALHPDIVPTISSWFNDQLLKPVQHHLTGKKYLCNSENMATYSTESNLAAYYDWSVTGGTIISGNSNSTEITILWDTLAPQHQIQLTPYSIWESTGDEVILDVEISNALDNTWISTSGLWNDPSSWTLHTVPQSCHNVIIPDQGNPIQINYNGPTTEIQSLILGENTTVNVPTGTILRIKGQ
jgi:alpha/beta superfamily hydrolase